MDCGVETGNKSHSGDGSERKVLDLDIGNADCGVETGNTSHSGDGSQRSYRIWILEMWTAE